MILAKHFRTPSFLIALGLCCYTEYWGKLKIGVEAEKQRSRESFEKFLCDNLDSTYYPQLKKKGLDIYKDVRCGLAHAYLIEQNSNVDASTDSLHGIETVKKERKECNLPFILRKFYLVYQLSQNVQHLDCRRLYAKPA